MKLTKIINRWVALGVSLLGIVALLILQFIWFRNAYDLSLKNIEDISEASLTRAIEAERGFRLIEFNIKTKESNNNSSIILIEHTVRQTDDLTASIDDLLSINGCLLNLYTVDSLLNCYFIKELGNVPEHRLFFSEDTLDDEYIYRDKKTNELIEASIISSRLDSLRKNATSFIDESKHLSKNTICVSKKINSYEILNLELVSPAYDILRNSRAILILSFVFLVLVAYILVFLMRSTLRENRFVRFIKEYTNALTHDLRSPLNSVHMASRILDDGAVPLNPEERKEYLRICREQSKNLLDSIDRILTVAKAEHTHLVVNPKRMMLKPFIMAQKEFFLKDMLHEKPVTVTIHCTPDDLVVWWDKEIMENVVNNLMDNAVKYSYESVDIIIDASIKANEVHVQFSDNGMGIPPKDLEGIFKYFHQGSLLERKRMFGYGIGLSFMKKIVEAHNGHIWVESQENKGSTFSLVFPIKEI